MTGFRLCCVGVMMAVVGLGLVVVEVDAGSPPFWPPVRDAAHCATTASSRPASSVTAQTQGTAGPALTAAIARYNAIYAATLAGTATDANNSTTPIPGTRAGTRAAAGTAFTVTLSLSSYAEPDVEPGTDASYSVDLTSDGTDILVKASTVYGGMAGLETVSQLLDGSGLVVAACSLSDSPSYGYRGLLVDSGRRFIPTALLRDIMDSMSFSKLNVLHLHLSDWAAVRVELTGFPELTKDLDGQFYTKKDVDQLRTYAKERGIAIVPEIDLPSHCGGLIPLEARGLQFCDTAKTLVYNDPANNNTLKLLTDLISAVSDLFPGTVFHLGGDEAVPTGVCHWETIHQLDRQLQEVVHSLQRQPVTWNEVFSNPPATVPNGALNTQTIIQNWHDSSSGTTTAAGYETIVSTYQELYLDQECCSLSTNVGVVTPNATRGKYCFWFPVDGGVEPANQHLIQGGAAAMWTDLYCAPPHCPQSGPWAEWYDKSFDALFSESFGSLIWPRASGAAGSFWNYDASLDQTSPEFNALMEAHNARLVARGSTTCPTGCSCNWNSKCGKPYGVTPKNPMAITLINNSTTNMNVKEAFPCQKTYGDKLAQLKPGESYTASTDFIVTALHAAGDPYDLWFGGGAGWRSIQQTLSMTIQGSYIAYNLVA